LYYCWFVPGEDVSVFDGLENPIKTIDDDIDPYKYVISANALRRHLTREQKRELIAKVLKASPEKSDRHIAQMIKADHKTVSAVRQQAEARGEIPHVTVRKDSRGRRTPAKRHAHGPRAAQKETNMAGAVHLEPERGVGLAAQPYDQLVAAWKVCCPDDQRRFLAHIGAKHQATRSRGLTATK
jgi:hypothetical protein